MGKRGLIITINLDEAEQEQFRGRSPFVVPLSPDEAGRLGADIMITHEALWGLSTDTGAVIEQLGVLPDGGQLVQGLTAWRDLAEGLHDRMDRVRQIIGRGKSVGQSDDDQGSKGRMQ